MKECIFCKIIKGELPCYKIYEDDAVLAFLDIAKDAVGHTLVIPKKHCENVMDAADESFAQVMRAVKKISKHYVENCGYSGVNILNASGKDAQQSVFHLHMHIIPRKANDGLNTWPHMPQKEIDMQKICDILRIK